MSDTAPARFPWFTFQFLRLLAIFEWIKTNHFKVIAGLLSSGLNWILNRHEWWAISGSVISVSTGNSSTVDQVLYCYLLSYLLLAINFAVKLWPDLPPLCLLVFWAGLCIAFTCQIWVTYGLIDPSADPEIAKAMTTNLHLQFITFTTIVFVLVIPADARKVWKAIKKPASGNQNRSLSQEV